MEKQTLTTAGIFAVSEHLADGDRRKTFRHKAARAQLKKGAVFRAAAAAAQAAFAVRLSSKFSAKVLKKGVPGTSRSRYTERAALLKKGVDLPGTPRSRYIERAALMADGGDGEEKVEDVEDMEQDEQEQEQEEQEQDEQEYDQVVEQAVQAEQVVAEEELPPPPPPPPPPPH